MATTDYDAARERLLRAVADEMRLPLVRIARSAELGAQRQDSSVLPGIQSTADMALRVIESYLLSIELGSRPYPEFEPVSIGAVLQDALTQLEPMAKTRGCQLDMHLGGRYEPVMARRSSLLAAYMNLGYAFIESTPEPANNGKSRRIILAARRTGQGLVTGVYEEGSGMQADAFRRAKALFGTARQVAPIFSHGNGAALFVADTLLTQLNAPLRAAHYLRLPGLAATLTASRQLRLV